MIDRISGNEWKLSWLTVTSAGKPTKRHKTVSYVVRDDHGVTMGYVRWFSPWRRYAFEPTIIGGVYEENCLRELADFCEQVTDARRVQRRAEKGLIH